MRRRTTVRGMLAVLAASLWGPRQLHARTYMSVEQAQQALFGGQGLRKVSVTLTPDQVQQIKSATRVRVRHPQMQVWKASGGGWFILDQVIGKHENIDYAVGLSSAGKVLGFYVLVYRESYGHEIRNPKWKAQFRGVGSESLLKLNKQIKNISGATLSCRHITDGINRLTKTWEVALRHL